MPEVDQREIDSAFGLCEAFEVSTKILGVVVDQPYQVFHQLTQGSVLCKPADDDQEARVASGQDLQRPDFTSPNIVTRHHLPQAAALAGIQRLQTHDPKQLEERMFRVLQFPKTTGGGGKQNDLGFRLQHSAKLPAEVVVHVSTQRLQVFDHQHEPLAEPIGYLQHSRASTLLEFSAVPLGRQGGVHISQFAREIRVAHPTLSGEVEQRLKPEVAKVEYLMALFREPDRQELIGEVAVGAQLGSNAGQQHGLSPTAGSDE